MANLNIYAEKEKLLQQGEMDKIKRREIRLRWEINLFSDWLHHTLSKIT